MNLLHLLGNLGADPEERFTSGGQKLWRLRLATRARKNGQDVTLWWNVTVWGDQFDKMMPYLKKGSPVYVVAEMTDLDIYTDKNGQSKVSYDATAKSLHFVSVGAKNQEADATTNQQAGGSQAYQGSAAPQQSMGQTDQPAAPSMASQSFSDDDQMPF